MQRDVCMSRRAFKDYDTGPNLIRLTLKPGGVSLALHTDYLGMTCNIAGSQTNIHRDTQSLTNTRTTQNLMTSIDH